MLLVRQLIHYDTFTYSYLVADMERSVAALIDPVVDNVESYLTLLSELNLKLLAAIDTHIHADHITALGLLREKTGAVTYVGHPDEVECSNYALKDGAAIEIGALSLKVLDTPGHTDDSFCLYLQEDQGYLFSGDTLLIRGTGRTDFQNGDPAALYDSIHNTLLTLPEETVLLPGHDYKGATQSTIGEEKRHNPRVLLESREAFIEYMNNLDLPHPKWMDIAVPANLVCGIRALGGDSDG